MSPDRVIARLARRQHALVALGQLKQAGVSRAQIRTRLTSGELERVHPKVLRLAGAPPTPEQLILASCLAAGTGSLASHRAAARLWGVPLAGHVVDVTVPPPRWPRIDGVHIHRSTRSWGATKVTGIPVTSPLRCALELGAVVEVDDVERAVDHFVRQRLFTWAQLREAHARESGPGRSGMRAIAQLLGERVVDDVVADSRLEVVLFRLVRRAGLPRPALHPILRLSGRRLVPDFAFVDARVLVEVDGYEFHGSREAFETDRARDAVFAAHGWLVLRFTWSQIQARSSEVAAVLRAVLARRLTAGPLVAAPLVAEVVA